MTRSKNGKKHLSAPQWPPGMTQALSETAAKLETAKRSLFEIFAQLLFARLGAVRGNTLPDANLAALALDTFHLIEDREPGPPCISVGRTSAPPRVPHHGRDDPETAHGLSVVTVINDDKPFLVSSVLAEIQARGLKTHLVLHPLHAVRRDESNRLVAIRSAAEVTDHDRKTHPTETCSHSRGRCGGLQPPVLSARHGSTTSATHRRYASLPPATGNAAPSSA